MKTKFAQAASVNHIGTVVAFLREFTTNKIYYNVLDLGVGSSSDNDDWTGYTVLDFPTELRPAGSSLITVNNSNGCVLSDAGAPFKVISDGNYVCMFRQSSGGTLLFNRFMLKSEKLDGSNETMMMLEPCWEVRFERSGKEDVPAGSSDTQNYKNPDGDPFIEPSIELSMIRNLVDGRFDVVLLPNEVNQYNWQFFAYNSSTSCCDLFSFPMDDKGLFDLTGKQIDSSGFIEPDNSFSLQSMSGNTVSALPFTMSPSAVYYSRQEKIRAADSEKLMVKRSGRVMLSVPVIGAAGKVMGGIIDFALSKEGTLSEIDKLTVMSEINPANYTLSFSNSAYLALQNNKSSLSIKGSFEISAWIYPASNTPDTQQVIGGDMSAAPQSLAPYIRLVNGNKISAGFGNGTALVSCVTDNEVIAPGAWYEISVTFDSTAASNNFTVSVNGNKVPVTQTGTGLPGGTPLSLIGAASNGFAGFIDSVKVYSIAGSDKTLLGSWAFDSVDYNAPVPYSPDSSPNQNNALVYGACLVPSSSPVLSNTNGDMQVDKNGLTTFAGYLPFVTPKSSPYLLNGSDGLNHLYYQDTSDTFCVVQYDVEMSRAVFQASWSASSSGGMYGSTTSSGFFNLVSARSGTYMNAATIVISDSPISSLCNVMFDTPNGTTETWKGVPRRLSSFIDVINGSSVSEPADPGISSGAKVFFDCSGAYPMAHLPVSSSTQDSYLQLVSRLPGMLPLYSVAVEGTDPIAKTCTVKLQFTPLKWNLENASDPGTLITQTWNKVPTGCAGFLNTLNGISPVYDYSSTNSMNVQVYGIRAASSASQGQNSNVLFFAHPEITLLEITISNGSSPLVCDVQIAAHKSGGEMLKGTWKDVSRSQVAFAAAINGTSSTGYDSVYGDNNEISSLLIVQTDGLSALVRNSSPSPSDSADMLAGASLFDMFDGGFIFTNETVTDQSIIHASVMQSATYTDGNGSVVLMNGSTLFGAVAATQASSGLVPMVGNTDSFTGGTADIIQYGSNGGWIQEPSEFALQFNGTNYISYDLSQSQANVLAPDTDMTLEMWCNPAAAANVPLLQRLVNFNKTGNINYPSRPFQYMAGLERGYCLEFGVNSKVHGSYNFSAPDCTIQLWANLKATDPGLIWATGTAGIYQPYLRLCVNDQGYYQVVYGPDGGAAISSKAIAVTGVWNCLSVTLSVNAADSTKVDLALYINGVLQSSVTTPLYDPGKTVGSFDIGSQSNGVAMYVNGAWVWNRALSGREVKMKYGTMAADTENNLVIRLNLTEGTGNTVTNTAREGIPFTTTIANMLIPGWQQTGVFFKAFTANRNIGIKTKDAEVVAGWNHLAVVYNSSCALNFTGDDSADCGSNASLQMDGEFSLECWIKPGRANALQMLVSKGSNYEIGINIDNTVYFNVWTSQGLISIKSAQPVITSSTYHVAATFITKPTQPAGSQTATSPAYTVISNLYINGAASANFTKIDYTSSVDISGTSSKLTMGCHASRYGYYTGYLSEVRLWNTCLSPDAITTSYNTHRVGDTSGLVSYWAFNEMKGKTAFDRNGINNAKLSSNELWSIFDDNAILSLYVNGIKAAVSPVNPGDYNGFGTAGFTAAALVKSDGTTSDGFNGLLNELRVWNVAHTSEQISDNMCRLLAGSEDGLAGYWPLEAGSGTVVDDETGNENNGKLLPSASPASWITSFAPLSNENKLVYNTLGGVKTNFIAGITASPSVVEYADIQQDAYGSVFSVMKRCYISLYNQSVTLEAGYKVGDLDTVYAGQVQTKPTVIGYFEGAPPVPSENQTMPFWLSDIDPAGNYGSMSSVQLTEADDVVRTYSSTLQDGSSSSLSGQAGIYLTTGSGQSFGVGAEVEWDTYNFEGHLGYQGETNSTSSSSNESGFSESKNVTKSEKMSAGGEWEDANDILNPEVGRRFVPDNTGYALVKSLTADLYIIRLKGSGAMVKMSVVPNADIPEDVNIITFPINAKYIKNGTLDGKVGLVNDPSYPGADIARYSYFKPLEAYALKREIERQDKQMEAFYQQFNTRQLSSTNKLVVNTTNSNLPLFNVTNGYQDFKNQKLKNDPAYDWEKNLSKRNMMNTYVWTAAGGTYSVTESVANTYTESYGNISSDSSSNGVHFDLAGAFIVGVYGELDALWGKSVEVTSTKSTEKSASFSLEVEASPDGLLKAPVIENGEFKGYSEQMIPGKVDEYRFMSFYLAPNEDNFSYLMSEVIDQNWLANSSQPAAVALREASSSANGVWRVLHRVTYVSRIAPAFQPVPAETQAPSITPPANLASNTIIVRLIEMQVGTGDIMPSPSQVGDAITAVLGTSASSPGLLGDVFPWWKSFLTQAADSRSTAYRTLYELKIDLLDYMIQKYDTDQYSLPVSMIETPEETLYELV